jgi:hypothetical protein
MGHGVGQYTQFVSFHVELVAVDILDNGFGQRNWMLNAVI